MGYQISFDGAGSPELLRLLFGAGEQFNEHGVALMAQADAPAAASAAPTGAADSGSQLPVIESDSVLWICPPTKHPVQPPCVPLALVEARKLPSPEHNGLQIGVVVVVVLIAVAAGFLLARLASR
jgi:hypothetical protein